MESKMGTILVRDAPLNTATKNDKKIPAISLPL
jgi:hypothetical protein